MAYDTNNIFAQILRGDIPCQIVYEDDACLAFHDAYPKAKIHVLVIPKGAFEHFHNFLENAGADNIQNYFKGIEKTIEILKLKEGGYRLVMNTGVKGAQTVPHYHTHILCNDAPLSEHFV